MEQEIIDLINILRRPPQTDMERGACKSAIESLYLKAMSHEKSILPVIQAFHDFAQNEQISPLLRKNSLIYLEKLAQQDTQSCSAVINAFLSLIRKKEIDPMLQEKAVRHMKDLGIFHPENSIFVLEEFGLLARDNEVDVSVRKKVLQAIKNIALGEDEYLDHAKTLFFNLARDHTIPAELRRYTAQMVEEIALADPFYQNQTIEEMAHIFSGDPAPSLRFMAKFLSLGLAIGTGPTPSEDGLNHAFSETSGTNLPSKAEISDFLTDLTDLDKTDIYASLALLQKMNLPIPKEGEFMEGTGCRIIFLTPCGLVLKIMNRSQTEDFEKVLGNDLILQPLKYIRLVSGSFAVFPGIRTSENYQETDAGWDFINHESQNVPVLFSDRQGANIGFLPVPWVINGHETEFPVVLDHGCIEPRGLFENPLSDTFRKASYHGMQERIYSDLKRKLMECWPDNEFPDPIKMPAFLDECAAIAALPENDPKRILSAGWAVKPNGKTESALLYETRLPQSSFFTAPKNSCTMP